MTRSPIFDCVAEVVREAALANGSADPVTGSTCPGTDVAGLDSPQLLHSTGEIAHRLGIEIPVEENVFYDGRRARTVDEIAAHVATFAPADAPSPLPSQTVTSDV